MAAKDTIAFIKLNDGSVWEGIQIVVDSVVPGTLSHSSSSFKLDSVIFRKCVFMVII